jgi:hypothetical protein
MIKINRKALTHQLMPTPQLRILPSSRLHTRPPRLLPVFPIPGTGLPPPGFVRPIDLDRGGVASVARKREVEVALSKAVSRESVEERKGREERKEPGEHDRE